MVHQSGVTLQYIKCTTFSQKAGWGPSHSISPPVPLSFSVTKPPSSLDIALGLALASYNRGGGGVEIEGTAGLTNTWHLFALSGKKSAVPLGEGLSMSLVQNPKLK